MNRLFLIASLIFLFSCQETTNKYGINSNENPFFQEWNTPFEVPPFNFIKDEHYMPAFVKGMDENIKESISVSPDFNTAIIFSTNSKTFHGHPDALNCPENISRKSLALYYFSTGRPSGEIIGKHHGTLFKKRVGEKFRISNLVKIQKFAKGICPPYIWATITKIRDKLFY